MQLAAPNSFVFSALVLVLTTSPAVAQSGCPDQATVVDFSGASVAACNAASLRTALAAGGRVRLAGCTSPIILTQPIVLNANVDFDGAGATLSGGGSSGIFVIDRLRRVHLQNLTLRDGVDASAGFTPGGGAIRGAQFGDLSVLNVVFENNRSEGLGGEDGGGAVMKDEGGKLTVFNSVFRNNLATNGGAIKALLTNVQIVNSSFIGNSARGGNNGGGAIFLDGLVTRALPTYAPPGATIDSYRKGRFCGLLVRDNTVGDALDFNNTGRQGGGIFTHTYPIGGASTRIEIERSVFINNRAAQDGGGIRIGSSDSGGDGGSAWLAHVLLRDNRAGNHGGAIRLSDANLRVFNSTLIGNCAGDLGALCSASIDGGGGLGGGIAAFDRDYDVSRLTVARNRAAGFSGALVTRAGGSFTASIAADNTVGNSFGVTRNCGSPSLLNGAASFEWPAPAGNQFEPGCGAANLLNPAVASLPSSCLTTVGAASETQAMGVYAVGVNVPRLGGVATAGAVCPESVDLIFADGFRLW